jgi:hypothetical protein
MWLKSYFETGKPARDAANAQAQVTAAAPQPTANA